jgi:hypothetical protein
MSLHTVQGLLSSAVATSVTFTTGYPEDGFLGLYRSGKNHRLVVDGTVYSCPNDFGVAFTSATVITVTWRGANTLRAGARWILQLDIGGVEPVPGVNNALVVTPVRVNLGAPIVADVDGIATVQLASAAGNFTLDGARVAGGVATLDRPRNFTLTGATTNHSAVTFTVTGKDEYGNTVVETLAGPNNNTVSGKKAFKTVSRVAVSGAIATNGVSVGFGDVLGLPVFTDGGGIFREREDGTVPTAGTFVAGLAVNTKSTATTADVRGTYDPHSACDGAKVFELDLVLADPTFLGNPQFAG